MNKKFNINKICKELKKQKTKNKRWYIYKNYTKIAWYKNLLNIYGVKNAYLKQKKYSIVFFSLFLFLEIFTPLCCFLKFSPPLLS